MKKSFFSTLFLVMATFLVSACAMTHPGRMSTSHQEKVLVSVNEQTGLSDKYYLFLEYTIENKSPDWVDIQFTSAQFDDLNSEILVNDKLVTWIEGASLKLEKAQYNTDLLLGSIAAVGAVTALASNDSNIQAVGLLAMNGATVAATGIEISREQKKVNRGLKGENGSFYVPSTHALTPFKIPPESHVRRWIVVENPMRNEKAPPLLPSQRKWVNSTSRNFKNVSFKTKANIKNGVELAQDEFITPFDFPYPR